MNRPYGNVIQITVVFGALALIIGGLILCATGKVPEIVGIIILLGSSGGGFIILQGLGNERNQDE